MKRLNRIAPNMKLLQPLLFGYALLIALSGCYGYFKGGSWVSLAMGLGFGLLLFGSALLLVWKKRWGLYGALCATFILSTTFAIRYIATGRMLPALLALLSALLFLYLIGFLRRASS